MRDVEVQPHADGVCRHQIINLAVLEQFDLAVARFGAQRPHHHRCAAAKPSQHLGDGIDLLCAEGDDGAAWRHARELLGAGVAERRKTRTADDLDLGHQRLDHRLERGAAQNHRLVAASGMQQAVGEYMPALAVCAQLRLVDPDKRQMRRKRHRFHRAQLPARIWGLDPLLAGDQRHILAALDRDDPFINLARKQPQRKADHAGRMRAQPFDRQVRLAGIGRAQHRLHMAVCAACLGPWVQWAVGRARGCGHGRCNLASAGLRFKGLGARILWAIWAINACGRATSGVP